MDRQKILAFSFIGLFLIIAIIGYIVLPDPVVLQINLSGGAGTTLPKLWAVLVLFALGLLGGVQMLGERAKASPARSYLIMVILLVVAVLVFVFNL